MLLATGEKIHVIHRQLFQGDARRHFVGTVEVCDGALARVNGYVFAADAKLNQFVRRGTIRTRIINLNSDTLIINVLPESVNIEQITYNYRVGGDVVVTDGSDWHLDITHL